MKGVSVDEMKRDVATHPKSGRLWTALDYVAPACLSVALVLIAYGETWAGGLLGVIGLGYLVVSLIGYRESRQATRQKGQ
jgi:hypothetical protein